MLTDRKSYNGFIEVIPKSDHFLNRLYLTSTLVSYFYAEYTLYFILSIRECLKRNNTPPFDKIVTKVSWSVSYYALYSKNDSGDKVHSFLLGKSNIFLLLYRRFLSYSMIWYYKRENWEKWMRERWGCYIHSLILLDFIWPWLQVYKCSQY